MSDFVISCLSQKGGVGKSTLARLLARTYAAGDWTVKICDFNVRQLTSVNWVSQRMEAGIEPAIDAQPYSSAKKLRKEAYDIVIVDGAPDSDQSSLDVAKISNLVVIPTGLTVDDLRPQVAFANELISKGVSRDRLMFVLNKTTDSNLAVREATQFLKNQGFDVATTDITAKTGYQMAQNSGFSIAETKYSTLNDKADELAAEIVTRMNELEEAA